MDALRTPVMFLLKDLMGDNVKGRYYKEQLRQAPTPGKDFDFEVSKILKTKTEDGTKFVFVKYEHYPIRTFNIFKK